MLVATSVYLAAQSPRGTRVFDLPTASIADINAAFGAGALTSEKLTHLYLTRIAAYDKQGPKLNALLILNPRAVDEARALDRERTTKGPRGPLHGIPVLIKGNIDVVGFPTTAGFYGLRKSMPAEDAEQTKRLRAAGCVILGITNMSEFASGPALSTLGGQMRNPHSLERTPAGSSGGNGAAIAAVFATFALGTDTGGSIRGPAAVNGITGLRPTHGLTGRGGIVPLALSLDTVGPMALHVADLATVLNVMVGPDVRDPAAVSRPRVDYTLGLASSSLKAVRLGLVRDFMATDVASAAVIETAVAVLRNYGAEVVDITLPRIALSLATGGVYETIRDTEFRAQIESYLKSLPGADLPKTHADIIRLSELIQQPTSEGWLPNSARLVGYRRESELSISDQAYKSALNDGRKIVRDILESLMATHRLDAFIGPTARPARLISEESTPDVRGFRDLSNMTGWPDLTVPAGFTSNPALPVGLSFLGPAFSEAKLLAIGAEFERVMPVRRLPVATPQLPGERFEY